MTDTQFIVQKLWNYCNVLRDDGLSYGDYVEQLTFLLFLKMAAERVELGLDEKSAVPEEFNWQSLLDRDGPELDSHYRRILEELGRSPQDERLRVIFSKAQNKIQDPAKLRRLIVDLIDNENWLSLDADVKGDAYEGLLQKNAEDTKGGAGQYFTPRPLIQAILAVMRPEPDTRICDPACGTGGFLLAAFEFITKHPGLDVEQKRKLENQNLRGIELVDSVARLCLMNMVLHGIGGDSVPIERRDSLEKAPSEHFDMVLTNPPFGKKSAVTIINKEGKQSKESLTVERQDFWTSTSNKQLNFLQHVYTMLKEDGRAAVVVPDNVLFEGGAGETVRKNLLQICDVHTLLRLPTGIFYAQGVKANVLFFDRRKGGETAATSKLWIYDFRTNQNFTLKERPLRYEDLLDFIQCYNPENRFERQPTRTEENPQGRWDCRSYEELMARDKTNLDIFWLKDDSLSDNLEEPDVIAGRMREDLQIALDQLQLIFSDMKSA
jgi:type I restriction enzyme M protein